MNNDGSEIIYYSSHYHGNAEKEDFNCYMLLCGNNNLKQKTVHVPMACYVHALKMNAEKHAFKC